VIADVKRTVAIPVIGNGDVTCACDVRDIRDETGVDGVMLGRAALSNPWVFRQIDDELSGCPSSVPTAETYLEALSFVISRLQVELPQKRAVNRTKALTGWITKGFPGGAELRAKVYAARSLTEITAAYEKYFNAGSNRET
jgi:tRNA-dihydrouridine synthase